MTIMQNSFYVKGRRGVTLLEILVAVAVLAFALSAIFQIFPMGFSASARASYTATAYELAGKKMEELRSTRIFGGDPDPSKANTNADTYAHFGLHVNHDDATRSWRNFSGTNPSSVADTSAYYFPDTNGVYKPFSTDGYDVESKYFYKVELVPQCDVIQKSGNFPTCYEGTATTSTSKWLGFCDAYRATVTVRGPVRSAANAQDDAWTHYKKAAVEVTLSTLIANKEFGVGYLAYDVVSRYVEKGGDQNNEKMRTQGINDSRTIFVTGPNGSRLYPENFTVLNPFHLTQNERWDTGPAIVVPPFNTSGESRIDGYYAPRSVYNYKYRSSSGDRNVEHQIDLALTDSSTLPPANLSWSNPQFGTSISAASTNGDNGGTGFRQDTGRTNLSQVGSPYFDIRSKYVPGGLNYLGQDNIMLVCKAKNKTGSNYSLYAESNKLIFMLPPKTTGEIVTCYGDAFKAVNNSNYWRFDLLNQIYGRDSDCATRENGTFINANGTVGTNNTNYPAYNADRLIDDQCGDTSLATTNPNRGDLSLNDFYTVSYPGTKVPQYFNPSDSSAKNSTRDSSGALTVVIGNGSEVNCSKVYGFPRAHFTSGGNLEYGTMVRFMMKLYKKSN